MGTYTFKAVNSFTSATHISRDVSGRHSLDSILTRFFIFSYAFHKRVDFLALFKLSRLLSYTQPKSPILAILRSLE